MTKGRTVSKYTRVYVDGYDVSGYARNVGPLSQTFAEGKDDPLNAALTGAWLGQGTVTPGTLNAIFDNTSDVSPHALWKTPPASRNVLVAMGVQAEPAEGDNAFLGQFRQDEYILTPEETPSVLSVKFGATAAQNSSDPTTVAYALPWGVLLHENSAETTDNAGAGVDLANLGMGTSDETAFGGWMMYQVLAGDGNAAIKVQDSSTVNDGDFADLLSSGTIDCSSPKSGVVSLAVTATVKQYVRWQVAWDTATTVTFVLAFVRGRKR